MEFEILKNEEYEHGIWVLKVYIQSNIRIEK